MPSTSIAADLTALLYARAAQKNVVDNLKKDYDNLVKNNAEVLVNFDKYAPSQNISAFANSTREVGSIYAINANPMLLQYGNVFSAMATQGRPGNNFVNPMLPGTIVNFRNSVVSDLQATEATAKNGIAQAYNKLAAIETNISATAAADPSAAKEAQEEFNNSQNNFFKNNQTTIIVVGIVVVIIAAIFIFKKI